MLWPFGHNCDCDSLFFGRMEAWSFSDSPRLLHSYLVMPFMATDLGKLMKMQRLSEDKVQYLVYQILRGLKVSIVIMHAGLHTLANIFSWIALCLQYIHAAGIIHRVSTAVSVCEHICKHVFLTTKPLTSSDALQDLKPGNLAVNEECELKVSHHVRVLILYAFCRD